jgi:hypothetical protein
MYKYNWHYTKTPHYIYHTTCTHPYCIYTQHVHHMYMYKLHTTINTTCAHYMYSTKHLHCMYTTYTTCSQIYIPDHSRPGFTHNVLFIYRGRKYYKCGFGFLLSVATSRWSNNVLLRYLLLSTCSGKIRIRKIGKMIPHDRLDLDHTWSG